MTEKMTGAESDSRSVFVYAGERVDDLQRGGLMIIQRPDAFCFGTDAVLLSDFAIVRPRDRVADLGTGTGILCFLMAANEPTARFDAIEVQSSMADMAARSAAYNGLEGRIAVHAMDMREAARVLGHCGHTLVVCNPPYSPKGTALRSRDETVRIARHADDIELDEICQSGARLLKNGGRMALVYPAARALQLADALRRQGMEPKRIRLVHDKADRAPKLVLIEAVKGAREMLHWLAPLILRDESGAWSDEWRRIYHKAD